MVNYRLKKQVLEVVENQLQMDDPKCTKETLERLMALEICRDQAKEMIASVLLEEMYFVLKGDQPFNEERYARKLNELKPDQLVETENDYINYSVPELIKLIEYNHGNFPKNVLQEIIKRKNEAVPFLLDILKNVLNNPKGIAKDRDYFAHIYAAYLLAQFRIVEAYPVFVEILKLPNELPHILYGDTICEAGSGILASICGNKLEPIKELIINGDVDMFVRGQAVNALSILVLQGLQPRDEIIEYYRRLLTGGIQDQNSYVMAEVVSCCTNLYPEELIEEIRSVYKQKLVDERCIDLDFVESALSCGKQVTLEQYRNDYHNQLINDTIDELKGWSCFKKGSSSEDDHMEEPVENTHTLAKEFKTGRNDPCPCGSGKKYKKCCGK